MPTLDTNNSLTTLALTKEFVGSTGTTEFDSRLSGAINSASHRANSHTGRLLKSRSYDQIYDGDGTRSLILDHYPIRESSSSEIQAYVVGSRDSYASTTDFDSESQIEYKDIYVNHERGELRLTDNSFTLGRENVRVVYTAGYSTTTASTEASHIPQDLQDGVHEMIAFQFEKQRQRAWITRSISHEDGSLSYFDNAPMTAYSALDAYKDRRG